jgi:pSer/pThr/pTyr-binding forkhead associated (FHA) protein
MWTLKRLDEEGQPVLFRLKPGAVKTIGRAARADLILDAALVSRLHCRLEAADDQVLVIDLDSTNGTFVNDERVHQQATLKSGDTLRIGRVELALERSAVN